MIENAVCAACGGGPESAASGGGKGCLVLYDCADGSSHFFHRLCAEPSLKPLQALPEMFRFAPPLLNKIAPRYLRRRAWEVNKKRKEEGAA